QLGSQQGDVQRTLGAALKFGLAAQSPLDLGPILRYVDRGKPQFGERGRASLRQQENIASGTASLVDGDHRVRSFARADPAHRRSDAVRDPIGNESDL